MTFRSVGVIGAGQMGAGIAQVAAQSGYDVFLTDLRPEALEHAQRVITKSLEKLVSKGRLSSEEQAAGEKRLSFVEGIQDLKDCHIVIEAVSEVESVKAKVFQGLDDVVSKEALICSNTSSLSVTRLASLVSRSERFGGLHFMNPVPLMPLVEGIRGLQTSDETFSAMVNFTETLGKVFIEGKDQPGFIVNRILMPMINEAVYALYEGIADAGAIDQAMKLGTNQPMGPLTLADFIGLDTCLAIMEVLYNGFADSKYRPCPLLRKYVEAGWLGRKTGRGFYNYSDLRK